MNRLICQGLNVRPPSGSARLFILALVLSMHSSRMIAGDASDLEFFEKSIRPILVDNCYSCHSRKAEKLKGGLLLETREDLLKGGDSGPAIVPGDVEKSLLVRAVRYTDENLQMPPKNKKLSTDKIAALESWVKMGAPAPDSLPLVEAKSDRSKHWAFQPVHRPAVPDVTHGSEIQDPIDNFVFAKLEEKQLTPSPKADKRTLIRRVTFDLTGLPPTPEEVRDFEQDTSPAAFSRVVDRLLASPQYGERWARHWLDVARYADTKGYVFEEERRYPYAYTYRDYVIRALNEDLPYDQFLIQQIAADQLPLGEDKRSLAALGFLTLGRRFLNYQPDIIDDRIDVVTRGMMGLTVACARCHDHKYDPITSKDYYSLYGVFASCSEPEEKPMLGGHGLPAQYSEYLKEHTKRLDELNTFRESKEAEIRSQLRHSVGQYLLAAFDTKCLADKSKAEALARERKLDPHTVQRWANRLEAWSHEPEHPVFGPWFAAEQYSDEQLAEGAEDFLRPLLFPDHGSSKINPWVIEAINDPPLTSRRDLADRYGALFADVDELCKGDRGHSTSSNGKVADSSSPVANSNPTRVSSSSAEIAATSPKLNTDLAQLRDVLYAKDSPVDVPENEITRLFDVPAIQKLRALKRKMEELDATHPGAPPRAMALQDGTPQTPHVFIRGNPSNLGAEVPRQFVGILAGPNQKPFQKGSGRLELAQAIASRQNPLTARVLVNRIWLQYFGTGLVRTPSDFGLRSEPPTHPELLDYLASRFMDEGWSLKLLHRWILLSHVYQQTSEDNALAVKVDPGNQLLWKMNRRRLDFESMRDSLLEVAGQIDLSEGGHAVDLTAEPFTTRRTIYGFVERQNLPGLFRTFDFASPDTSSPQRFTTTVPQQGLFMLNSTFAVQQAEGLAARARGDHACSGEQKVRTLYELLYQREPNASEIQLGLKFIEAQDKVDPFAPEPVAWEYGYGTYDPEKHQIEHFAALPHFAGESWQGGSDLPDAKLGWVQLRANGGHPGNDHSHAAVRRWVAPRHLTVTISGTVRHESDKGDGIEACVCSSQTGALGHWVVMKGKQEIHFDKIEVTSGETLDFIVDCRREADSDSFTWAPIVKVEKGDQDSPAGLTSEWDARQDFSGPKPTVPPLDAWGRYAQVLLMANEFVFVD